MIENIRRIEQNVLILSARLKQLRLENAALKQNNLQLDQQNAGLETELCDRKNEVNELKMLLAEKESKGSEVTARNHQVRQYIDSYIFEIDKCIERLKHY